MLAFLSSTTFAESSALKTVMRTSSNGQCCAKVDPSAVMLRTGMKKVMDLTIEFGLIQQHSKIANSKYFVFKHLPTTDGHSSDQYPGRLRNYFGT